MFLIQRGVWVTIVFIVSIEFYFIQLNLSCIAPGSDKENTALELLLGSLLGSRPGCLLHSRFREKRVASRPLAPPRSLMNKIRRCDMRVFNATTL